MTQISHKLPCSRRSSAHLKMFWATVQNDSQSTWTQLTFMHSATSSKEPGVCWWHCDRIFRRWPQATFGLLLTASKTQIMLLKPRGRDLTLCVVKRKGIVLSVTNVSKYLGVWIDDELTSMEITHWTLESHVCSSYREIVAPWPVPNHTSTK